MRRGFFAAILAGALVAGACGGSSETDPTRFGAVDLPLCETAPVTVPGITVLGYRIENVSEVTVCVDADVKAVGTPEIVNQPDCGDPCFSIEVRELEISEDVAVEITYKRDGVDQDPIVYDPDPAGVEPETGRLCVVGVGGPPDPCADRVTQPQNFSATSAKKKVNLRWDASMDTSGSDVTYELWRSDSGEEGTFAPVATTSSTSLVDPDVTIGTTYTYYVRALAGEKSSLASDLAQVTVKKKGVSGDAQNNNKKNSSS